VLLASLIVIGTYYILVSEYRALTIRSPPLSTFGPAPSGTLWELIGVEYNGKIYVRAAPPTLRPTAVQFRDIAMWTKFLTVILHLPIPSAWKATVNKLNEFDTYSGPEFQKSASVAELLEQSGAGSKLGGKHASR
jgi:hypothetical protein